MVASPTHPLTLVWIQIWSDARLAVFVTTGSRHGSNRSLGSKWTPVNDMAKLDKFSYYLLVSI